MIKQHDSFEIDKENSAQGVKTEFYVERHKISIWNCAGILDDADPIHPATLIEFSNFSF